MATSTQKPTSGVGGWLLLFFLAQTVACVLAIAAALVLQDAAFSIAAGFTVLANLVALVLLGRTQPRGVPLAQRALVATFLLTLHFAIVAHRSNVEFLEVTLGAVALLLVWLFYFGFSLRAAKQFVHVDFSRRIAAMYPTAKRDLPALVRLPYTLLLCGYAGFLFVLWFAGLA
jgi:hypothetical protein